MTTIKFGTDGWRAVMAREFTFDNVALVAQAVASYMHDAGIAERGIMVGYDARFLSEHFSELIAEVLTANGIRTILPDRDIPTPVVAYTIKDRNLGGAVMLTASHNPPQYNGIKFIPDYCHPALPDVTKAIEKHIERLQVNPNAINRNGNSRMVEIYNPKPSYFKHLKTILNFDVIANANLKLWYDPLHASGRDYLDDILRQIGADIQVINNIRNPLFGGALPDPNAYNLRDLSKKVVESGAHLGLSTDGDADRFGIVDSDGTYLNANQTIALALRHLLQTRKPEKKAVVRTVVTTRQVDAIAEANGFEVIETPVGFKYVGQSILQSGAILGGEESGGFTIYGHIPEKDGIVADLTVVEAVAQTGKTCRQLLDEISSEYGAYYSKRIDMHITEDAKEILLNTLQQNPPSKLDDRTVVNIKMIDGAQLMLDDGSWVLARPSGTEPIIRIYAESRSEEGLADVHKAMAKFVAQIDPNASPVSH